MNEIKFKQNYAGQFDLLEDVPEELFYSDGESDFSDNSSEEKGLNVVDYTKKLSEEFDKIRDKIGIIEEIYNKYKTLNNILEETPLNIVEKIEINLLLLNDQIEKILSNEIYGTEFTHISVHDCLDSLNDILRKLGIRDEVKKYFNDNAFEQNYDNGENVFNDNTFEQNAPASRVNFSEGYKEWPTLRKPLLMPLSVYGHS